MPPRRRSWRGRSVHPSRGCEHAPLTPGKIIHVEAKKEIRKRIVRELQIMHDCQSEYIVQFYGAMLNDTGDVIMCMEYMDCG